MRKKSFLVLAVFILLLHPVFCQQRYTISGFVKDAKTGEDLIGATITVKESPGKGAVTNAYGFYSFTLPSGYYELVTQYVGYVAGIQGILLDRPLKINFSIQESVNEIEEVVVTTRRANENISLTQMGVQKMDAKELKSIPVLFGEKDLLKTIQLLPGIKAAGEGSSGFSVRGGATDQNLILLDEATVYNASHLMGFFSVFNSDAIKDIAVFKGNEPAEYGGRLSSVLDIKMNDGNNQKFGVMGGIGIISSRLTLDGPIVKNKGSFIISARRTYADMFLKLSKDTSLNTARLYFYDINVKGNYKFNDKNRIFLSGYFGKDVLGLGSTFGINWGNATGTVRWNHLFSDKMFSNTSLIFSNYNYTIAINSGTSLNIISRLQDYGIKQDFQYFINEKATLKFGLNINYHRIIPGVVTTSSTTSLKNLTNKNAWENAFYISQQYRVFEKLDVEVGARLSQFSLMGPGAFYSYDAQGDISNTRNYSSTQIVKAYWNIEPRITLNYSLDPQSSLKAAYARNVQNLHLLSNSTSGNPTDLWIPSSNNVKPELADQVSLGYFRNFHNNQFEFSTEIYYKALQHQIDYKNGAELNLNDNAESQILFGEGRTYGLEMYLRKKTGRFNGWISYTLSRTERKFSEINQGHYYPARQDRTHDIAIVGIFDLNKKLTFSATWVYTTGNAVTFPAGKYSIEGVTRFYYTDRNANRMPSYQRMDVGATWMLKKTTSRESSLTFSIYNAYAHENAYTITFRDSKLDPAKTETVQTTLFKLIPSISYNFKF